MRKNRLFIKAVTVLVFIFISIQTNAQSAQPQDKGTYYYFSALEFLLDKNSNPGTFYQLSPAMAGNKGYAFATFAVDEKRSMITVNIYDKDKSQLTTELYTYSGQGTAKKAAVAGEQGGTKSISWNVIGTAKVE